MSVERAFCTDLAIAQQEPLAGTGAMAARHMFLRWPKGKWRRPRYESAGLEPMLQRAIHESYGPDRYVGLIESDGRPDLELITFPDSRTAQPSSQQEAAVMIRAWASGTPLSGPALPRPVILCCTDAKINACCARYGFPIYKALRDQAPAFGFDVAQTTHFGGCHFAPSLIVMPHRARYGRLTAAEIPDFLATLAEGRNYLAVFKGTADLSEIDQCVEIAAGQWAETHGFRQTDVRLIAPAATAHDAITVPALVGETRLDIALRQQQFFIHGTCRAIAEDEGKLVTRWVVKTVTPATA